MTHNEKFILITGATGHVGSATLLHLLRAGHHVRAAVRSQAKAAAVWANPQVQKLNPGGRLTFVIVPDITTPGAYDLAASGVTHIIHIASPLVTGDDLPLEQLEDFYIQPAARGTLNILEAADRAGTVRRVVITSSIVALLPVEEMEGTRPRDSSKPVLPTDRQPFVPGPYSSEFAAYAASKVVSLQTAESYMMYERPAFDAVFLHPSFVIGRNDAAVNAGQAMSGTNAIVLAMLMGKSFGTFAGATVHVDDVAFAHVAALEPSVFEGSYILSREARWNDAKAICKREFPDARLLVGGGNVDSTPIPIDASLTEATFGFRHASYNEQVKSVVAQFLELRRPVHHKRNSHSVQNTLSVQSSLRRLPSRQVLQV